jgi:hypothetical protein
MTQTGEIGFERGQIIGIVIGAGLVAAVFACIMNLKRRRKAARNERPPQPTKILRPPGYSLSCHIDDLAEKWGSAVMQSILAGAVAGLLCSGLFPLAEGLVLRRFTFAQVRANPQSYIFLSLLILVLSAFAWLIAEIIRAVRLYDEIRNCRFGLRGEQAVAESLISSTAVTAGYVAFHDVPGDGAWNIDHVMIGPGGVFVLETKTRSRRKPRRDQPDNKVCFDGRTLQFPWCEDHKAVRQVQRNADWVKRFIADFAPKDMVVQPVIVVPGWYVEAAGNYPVKVMNAKYLVENYLLQAQRRFSPEQLKPLIRRFDERCRDLEF